MYNVYKCFCKTQQIWVRRGIKFNKCVQYLYIIYWYTIILGKYIIFYTHFLLNKTYSYCMQNQSLSKHRKENASRLPNLLSHLLWRLACHRLRSHPNITQQQCTTIGNFLPFLHGSKRNYSWQLFKINRIKHFPCSL